MVLYLAYHLVGLNHIMEEQVILHMAKSNTRILELSYTYIPLYIPFLECQVLGLCVLGIKFSCITTQMLLYTSLYSHLSNHLFQPIPFELDNHQTCLGSSVLASCQHRKLDPAIRAKISHVDAE